MVRPVGLTGGFRVLKCFIHLLSPTKRVENYTLEQAAELGLLPIWYAYNKPALPVRSYKRLREDNPHYKTKGQCTLDSITDSMNQIPVT